MDIDREDDFGDIGANFEVEEELHQKVAQNILDQQIQEEYEAALKQVQDAREHLQVLEVQKTELSQRKSFDSKFQAEENANARNIANAQRKLKRALGNLEKVQENFELESNIPLSNENVDSNAGFRDTRDIITTAADVRQSNETEKEYLLRVGRITPFEFSTAEETLVDSKDYVSRQIQNKAGDSEEQRDAEEEDEDLGNGYRIEYNLWKRLFEYQRTAVRWLWELHLNACGGIVGDEMGLGKTVQVAAFLGGLHRSCLIPDGQKCLVVAPVTMIDTWLRELSMWAPDMSVNILHATLSVRPKHSRKYASSSASVKSERILRSSDENSSESISEEISGGATRVSDADNSSGSDAEWNPHEQSRRLSGARRTRQPREKSSSAKTKKRKTEVSTESNDFKPNTEVNLSSFKDATVVITSYGYVQRRYRSLLKYSWAYIILDEGHKIRNPSAAITIACKQFMTPHRLIMSGSPLQNRLRELWSLFDFVFPGKLGSQMVFETQFSVPIALGSYSTASPEQAHVAFHCARTLKDLISPYLLRRVKRDVALQLPPKSEHLVFCKLTKVQRKLYETYVHSKYVAQVLAREGNLLAAITELRKLCNHPSLATTAIRMAAHSMRFEQPSSTRFAPKRNSSDDDEEGAEFSEDDGDETCDLAKVLGMDTELEDCLEDDEWKLSGKMIVLDRMLSTWQSEGHRLLLFSQTRIALDILERHVRRREYKFLRMDGTTAPGQRMRIIDEFNADDSDVFVLLLTTKVGGLGVTLTGADRVLIFDPDWNPSTDLQARERAWRVGQKRSVQVFRLLTSGTIEEKMYHRQVYKQLLSNKVLNDPQQRRIFRRRELRELFALGADADVGTETGDLFAGSAEEVKSRGGGNGNQNQTVVDASKNEAMVKAEEHAEDGGHDEDDKVGETKVLRMLFDGGVHSVMDHDKVMGSAKAYNGVDLAIVEYDAAKIAHDAAKALEASRRSMAIEDEESGRFHAKFGLGSSGVPGMKSSQQLLQNLRKQSTSVVNVDNLNEEENSTKLLRTLVDFLKLKGGRASTREILGACKHDINAISNSGSSADPHAVSNTSAKNMAILKAALKRVARLVKSEAGAVGTGVWVLVPRYAT